MRVAEAIADGHIHVWRVDMDDPAWDALVQILPLDELEKAARFRTPALQQRYRRCRIALRRLLAQYAGRHPADITFHYGRFGKPELPGQRWHFNLSHSNRLALIAISPDPIGVDLECMEQPRIAIDELIGSVCHPDEQRLLHSLDPAERHAAFYQLWTQKEAYCKALGVGLQLTLSTLRFEGHAPWPVSRVVDETVARDPPFFVRSIAAIPGYAACICTPSYDAQVRFDDAVPAPMRWCSIPWIVNGGRAG